MPRICSFLILLLCFSCSTSPAIEFDRYGISFSTAPGWEISDEGEIDGFGYSLTCEKSGWNESGILTLAWTRDSLPLSVMMDSFRSNMESEQVNELGGIEFGTPVSGQYGLYEGQMQPFSTSFMGVPHEGKMYAFYGPGMTIFLLEQGASEDLPGNQVDFDVIRSSFRAKSRSGLAVKSKSTTGSVFPG